MNEKRYYVAPELGFAFGLQSDIGSRPFLYAAGIGKAMKNGLDISLRYEKMTGHIEDYLEEIKRPAHLALRVEYGFNLNSGKSKPGSFTKNPQEFEPTGKHKKYVFIELLGNSPVISANYDVRLKPDRNDGFGFRAGIGSAGEYISLPLGINYILGKKRSGFETGLGITPAFYPGKNQTRPADYDRFETAAFLSAGYRLQSYNGFMLRANASLALDGYDAFLWPGLSIGYSFGRGKKTE